MYLKRLYKESKWWFAIALCFVTVQLVMDAKEGAAISPVFHYVMYSYPQMPQKKYAVLEVKVNGKLLQTKDFSPYYWDKIAGTPALFYSQKIVNPRIWNNDVKRLLHAKDSSKFYNHLTDEQYNDWYKLYLQNCLNRKIDSFSVITTLYKFNGSTFTKTLD